MIESILILIKEAQLPVIALSVALFWLYKLDFSGVFNLVYDRKTKELELLLSSLSNHHLSDNVKRAIQENVETQLFYKTYGITADKPFRDALVEINRKHPYKARWYVLKRAYPFIELGIDGKVELRVGFKDVILDKVVSFISYAIVFLGFSSIIIAMIGAFNNITITSDILVLGLSMILLGMYFHWTTWGRSSAIKLSKLKM